MSRNGAMSTPIYTRTYTDTYKDVHTCSDIEREKHAKLRHTVAITDQCSYLVVRIFVFKRVEHINVNYCTHSLFVLMIR